MATKTYEEILDELNQDFENQEQNLDTSKGSVIFLKNSAYAAAVWGLYKKLDWMEKQMFPDTASSKFLDRHAAIRGIIRENEETDAHLLERVMNHLRRPPAGGNQYDIQRWTRDFSTNGKPVAFLSDKNKSDVKITANFNDLNSNSEDFDDKRRMLFNGSIRETTFKLTTADKAGQSITFEFPQQTELFRLGLNLWKPADWMEPTDPIKWKMEYSEDNNTWNLAKEFDMPITGWTHLEFYENKEEEIPFRGKFWRLSLATNINNSNPENVKHDKAICINEMELFTPGTETIEDAQCHDNHFGPGSFAVLAYNKDTRQKNAHASGYFTKEVSKLIGDKIPVGLHRFEVHGPVMKPIEMKVEVDGLDEAQMQELRQEILDFVNTLPAEAPLYPSSIMLLGLKKGAIKVIPKSPSYNTYREMTETLSLQVFEKWNLSSVSVASIASGS